MGLPPETSPKRTKSTNREVPRDETRDTQAASELRLKSRWESIFDKYGHDFDDISDVIDMRSGSVMVDRGHLQNMRHERDVGRSRATQRRPARERPSTPPRARMPETIAGSDDSADELSSPMKAPSPTRQVTEPAPAQQAAPLPAPVDTSALAQSITTSIQPHAPTSNPAMSELFAELGKSFASAIAPILQQALTIQPTASVKWATPPVPEEAFLRNELRASARKTPSVMRPRSESPEMEESPPRRVRSHEERPRKRRSIWEQHETRSSPVLVETSRTPAVPKRRARAVSNVIAPEISEAEAPAASEEPEVVIKKHYSKPRKFYHWSDVEDDLLKRLSGGHDDLGLSEFRRFKDHFPNRSLSSIQWRYIYKVKPFVKDTEEETTDVPREEAASTALPTPPNSRRRNAQRPLDETDQRVRIKKRKRYERRSLPDLQAGERDIVDAAHVPSTEPTKKKQRYSDVVPRDAEVDSVSQPNESKSRVRLPSPSTSPSRIPIDPALEQSMFLPARHDNFQQDKGQKSVSFADADPKESEIPVTAAIAAPPPKKKMGRPRKVKDPVQDAASASPKALEPVAKKKLGRPRKNSKPADVGSHLGSASQAPADVPVAPVAAMQETQTTSIVAEPNQARPDTPVSSAGRATTRAKSSQWPVANPAKATSTPVPTSSSAKGKGRAVAAKSSEASLHDSPASLLAPKHGEVWHPDEVDI